MGQPNSQPPTRLSHRDKMQYVANAFTVAAGLSGVAALVSGENIWVLPIVAAIGFMVYSLRRHRFGSAAFGLLVVVFLVIAGIYNAHSNTPAASEPATTLGASQNAPAAVGSSAPKASNAPKVLVEGKAIVLGRSQGIDVDLPGQAPQDSSGPAGSLDIFFDPGSLPGSIYFHGGETVYNPSRASNHYAACKNQFDPSASNRSSQPSLSAYLGSDMCFRTSEGRMGWAAVAAVTQPIKSQAATEVTLQVIVWDETITP